MAFLDESGFLLIPNVRKTWAPMGQTPVLRHSYRRDKVSVIGSLTVSPRRQRLGLYLRFHIKKNLTGLGVIAFLEHLLRHLPGHVVLIWDGGKIHKNEEVKAFLGKTNRLHVYPFPGYAPTLNPIEQVWTHGKRDLSNSVHEGLNTLAPHLRNSLRRVRNSQQLLRSCIEHSELPWP